MSQRHNEFGQPVGDPLPNWVPPPPPPRQQLDGIYCRLEPLDPARHAAPLFAALAPDVNAKDWTYLTSGPFHTLPDYRAWVEASCRGDDPLFFAIIDLADAQPAGVASYMRIAPGSGSVEVGHIHYAPRLRQTPAATEAMVLMMRQAFALGYRRYEWKCDALNAPSRAAAQRLGLSFEGIFRRATVYKGRSRDTAWYAATDADWPALNAAFQTWLSPENFDDHRRQRVRLSTLTLPLLCRRG